MRRCSTTELFLQEPSAFGWNRTTDQPARTGCSEATELRRHGGAATMLASTSDGLRFSAAAPKRYPYWRCFSARPRKRSPHERQSAGHLPDRGAIGGGTNADGHGLTSKLAVFLDDELVRQGIAAERFGDASERHLVGHRERDDDRRRVARCFGGRVSDLGDLRTVGKVSPD